MEYSKKLISMQIFLKFMGELAKRYDYNYMHKMWQSLDDMRKKYGDVFVANAIKKDPKDAELALFRYVHKKKIK